MKRKIIEIDDEKCNGCGQCVTGCAEGALQIVNGKARLVKEQFCDGLGDCIGECPTGALKIIEREAEAFDEKEVERHLAAQKQAAPRSCPGNLVRTLKTQAAEPVTAGKMPQVNRSEIQQWPVLLHLVPAQAPFFKDKEFVLLSTCSTVASPDVQWRYIRGRSVAVACPKFDRTEGYVKKLADIIDANTFERAYVIRMQVPCCGGLTMLMRQALEKASRSVAVIEVTVSAEGNVLSEKML